MPPVEMLAAIIEAAEALASVIEEIALLAEELQAAGVDCRYLSIASAHGHDSFLAEPDKLVHHLREFVGWVAPLGTTFRAGRSDKDGARLKQADGSVA